MPDPKKPPESAPGPLLDSVEQLAALLGEPEGAPTPLEGGITNRNYRARFGGREVVIRLPGKDTGLLDIDREAECAANRCGARAGVAPEVAAMLEDPPCLVTEFVVGAEMSAEELRGTGALGEVAEILRRVHDCGERLPTAFSPFRTFETYAERAADRGADVPLGYEAAHAAARLIEAALAGEDPVPCHNDLLAANFLRSEAGIRLVDWENAGMGDRYFDLGNFAVNNDLDAERETIFLGAYLGRPAGPRELSALRLMRFMSDFREAMWGVLQSTISDLEFDFDAYAATHFARLREAEEDPRFETWLEAAGGAAG